MAPALPFTLPPLYPILDAVYFPAEPSARAAWLSTTVAELADAGVTLLQLRAKHASRDQLLRDAEAVRSAAPANMLLILNDYAELCTEADFDGAHLGQGDLSVSAARQLLPPGSIIGVSTHTALQVLNAEASDADYVAVGPVFATQSKQDAEPAVGLEGVALARQLTRKPLVAIGGITLSSAPQVWQSGADSVAVIGALFASGASPASSKTSPGTLARDFLQLFK